MNGIVVFIIFVVVAIVIPQAVRQTKRINRAWQGAAADLGLGFRPSGLFVNRRMFGRAHGYRVEMSASSEGGKNNSKATKLELRFDRPLPEEFDLSTEGFFGGVKKMLGAGDIQIGDPEFDDRFLVQGADAEALRRYLTPARREKLLRFFGTYPGTRVTSNAIQIRVPKVIDKRSDAFRIVRHATQLAQMLEEAADLDLLADEPLEASPDEALPTPPQEVTREELQRQFVSMVDEVRGTTAGSAFEEPGKGPTILPPAPVLPVAPPPDLPPAPDLAAVPEPPPLPEAPAPIRDPLEPVAAPADEESGAAEAAELLFREGALSSDSTRLFGERFAGETVRWKGTLLDANSYPFDFVFGSSPGVKATLLVHKLSHAKYGGGEVKAVIQLPPDVLDEVRSHIGRTVEFEGELVKLDAFMKQIFVGSARVV